MNTYKEKTYQTQAMYHPATLMRQVFTTMTFGLAITGLAAWWVAHTPAVFGFLFAGPMMWVTMLAPLAIVWFLSARINHLTFSQASLAFATYALVNGLSFSVIFMAFSLGAIFKVFLITAGTFGVMAFAGYTTAMDLSKMGSILSMALIGLVIAMVVNWFLDSSLMDYVISVIGVVIFSGLTAYDTQKILGIAAHADPEQESTQKLGVLGALTLYLDFINLFMFLLRLFGGNNRD
ncbi:MAG: Bax inhibitor-1/YccA family protein [Bacteroidia bacterium]|nr:Bax inhibitor-1/YccA family protein [Bacteroidia bacterium]